METSAEVPDCGQPKWRRLDEEPGEVPQLSNMVPEHLYILKLHVFEEITTDWIDGATDVTVNVTCEPPRFESELDLALPRAELLPDKVGNPHSTSLRRISDALSVAQVPDSNRDDIIREIIWDFKETQRATSECASGVDLLRKSRKRRRLDQEPPEFATAAAGGLESVGSETTACPICMEEFVLADGGNKIGIWGKRDRLMQLQCSHRFHARCVGRWVLSSRDRGCVPSCPLCRSLVAPEADWRLRHLRKFSNQPTYVG